MKKYNKQFRQAMAAILVLAMLAALLPEQMLSVFAAKTTATESVSILENGSFNTDLTGWTDKEGTFSVDASQGKSEAGSMKIEQSVTPSRIRTDAAVVAGVEYMVSYWAKASTDTYVQVVVYEYTFDNKIVAQHDTIVESGDDAWKQGTLTFSASNSTDSVGLVLVVDGDAGTVYVDDVTVTPQTTAEIAYNPNDCNGDDLANVADIVHMKKAVELPQTYELRVEKYADRNGDGAMNEADLVTLRERLVGKNEDDFTYTQMTSNAEGVKLKPILPEERKVLTGKGIKTSEAQADVTLSASNYDSQSGDGYTYLVTNESYGNEHIEMTFDVKEGTNPAIGIGLRTICTLDYWSSKGAKTGIFFVLHSSFMEVKGFNINNSAGFTDMWYNPMIGEPVTLSGETTIAFDFKEEGEKSVLYITTTTGGNTYQVSVDITGIPNETGHFAVWNGTASEREFIYHIGEPVTADPRDTAYATTGGAYTNEAFAFTTDVSYSEDERLYVGARIDGEVSRDQKKANGLIMGFDGTDVEVYAGGQTIATVDFLLDAGVDYKFFTKVEEHVLTISAYEDIQKVAFAEIDISSVPIPEQGDFTIWSSDECRDVLYSAMPQKAFSAKVVEEDGESDVLELTTPSGNTVTDFANRGYLAMKGDYTEERFEFTTKFDGSSPNLGIGVRAKGVSGTDYAQDGIFFRLYSNFVEVYQQKNMTLVGPSASAGTAFNYHANGAALATGVYTFAVELQEANDKTYLFFDVYDQAGAIVCQKTIAVASDAIPDSGNFIVWSGNPNQEIAYQMPYMDYAGSAIYVGADKEAASYTIEKPTSGNATLALLGDYADDYAEFTTTIADKTSPKLVLGARVGNYTASSYSADGVFITFGWDATNNINFYQIYANGWGSTATVVSGSAAGHVKFEDGEEYTFGIKVTDYDASSILTLLIYQEEQILLQKEFETSSIIPDTGNFVIWSSETSRAVSYEMPKQIENIGSAVTVSGETAGFARLTNSSTYSYLEVDDDYTKEGFVFATEIEEATDAAPYMYIGARRSSVGNAPTSGTGVVVGLYKNFYCIYAPAYAEQIAASNYWVNGVTKPLEAGKYTFYISMGDTQLQVSITQEDGWTHTKTFDLTDYMEHIPTSGSFAVWCTDTITDITYQVPAFTNVTNPIALYADSTLSLNPYAYSGPSNGNGQTDTTNYQTEASYEKYYDAGFRAVLMDGNDAYESYLSRMVLHDEDEATAKLNANLWNVRSRVNIFRSLNENKQKHLKLIVFDAYLEYLSKQTTALYGADGSLYASRDALKADVAATMQGYLEQTDWKDYILGVALRDEPSYSMCAAYTQVAEVILEVASEYGWENFYIHTELLPYSRRTAANAAYDGNNYGYWDDAMNRWDNAPEADAQAAYQVYLEAYGKLASADIGYDNYPFNQTINAGSKYFTSSYLYNLQTAAKQMQESGKQLQLTVQSYGSTYITTPTEAAMRYQLNLALAFGVKNIRYYTYWYFPNANGSQTAAIVNTNGEEGENDLYTEVQSANADARKLSKAILNYEYVKSACVAWDSSLHANVTSSTLDAVTATADQCTLINQMKDHTNDLNGYMVVNGTNPIAGEVTDNVILTFSGYDYATYYVKGEPKMVALDHGKLTLSIPSGEGVFVIPHN